MKLIFHADRKTMQWTDSLVVLLIIVIKLFRLLVSCFEDEFEDIVILATI